MFSQRTSNLIHLFNLTNHAVPAQDRTSSLCGSLVTDIGPLDITRCTITHELGHVLVGRAVRGVNFEESYPPFPNLQPILGYPTLCPSGNTRWDPGDEGWPWRDHPIRGSGSYVQNLCATEESVVIREFEADMLMNFFLNWFNDPNDYYQIQRRRWLEEDRDRLDT